MKKIVLLAFVLVLLSIAVVVMFIRPVIADKSIYIEADGSVVGTDKIQRDGNVYTFTDNINDSIVVERDNIVVDGAGYILQGMGSGVGIKLTESSNVTIKNMEIKTFKWGIWLLESSNNTLSGNTITNSKYGIELSFSSNNSIYGNKAANNGYGIMLHWSSRSCLYRNVMSGNRYNFGVRGWRLGHFIHSIDVSNLVDGKPVYYLVSQMDLVINPATHPQVGYLALINCTNVTVEGLTLTNNEQGLLLANTKGSRATGNNITKNKYGIHLSHSSNNSLCRNKITKNQEGIRLYEFSYNNTISGNNITRNKYGISLSHSSNNNIHGNHIANNDDDGIGLGWSSNNTIYGNKVANNGDEGISLWDSSNNTIYRNNFVWNGEQVYSHESINVWDDGYPSGGNFWTEYTDVDFYRGPHQNETGGDGIWDHSYNIDDKNRDRYPFSYPFMCLICPWGDVEPPVADAGPDKSTNQSRTVIFNGFGSTDDVAIKSFVWTFTDVTPKTLTGIKPKYTFKNAGDFEVTLNVTDYTGKWDIDTMWVHVSPDTSRLPIDSTVLALIIALIAIGVIVTVVGVAFFAIQKKKKPPEVLPPRAQK